MKIIKRSFCIILLVLVLASCMSPRWKAYHPSQYPGSTYISEDGNITITISEDSDTHRGTLMHNGECISMVFLDIKLTSNGIGGQTVEQFDSGVKEEIVSWRYVSVHKDKFVVESVRKTDFFEKGDKITFFRTGDGSLS